MLKGEHATKKWQNCGTEVLCVMLFYDGADLTRIVNKVLGKHSSYQPLVFQKTFSTAPFLYK